MNEWQGPPPAKGTPPATPKPFSKWLIPIIVAAAIATPLATEALTSDAGEPWLLAAFAIAVVVGIIAAGVWLGIRLSRRP